MSNQLIPMSDIEKMGKAIAESGLFGIKSTQQAVALMLIAQAEGLHPAVAARDYHIIDGRPSLKADAMLARFQQSGGTVKFLHLDEFACVAVFSHPQGGTVEIKWTIEMAKTAGLPFITASGKPGNWTKYPRQMLRARTISEGIRTIWPAVTIGIYTPEEVQDFDDKKPEPTTFVEQVNVCQQFLAKIKGKEDIVENFLAVIKWPKLDDLNDTQVQQIMDNFDSFMGKASQVKQPAGGEDAAS